MTAIQKHSRHAISTLGLTALIALPGSVSASSFQILEQSPAHLGKAFAGTASDINDASTVFFNPAGMTKLDERTVTVGLNGIMVRSEFNDIDSNTGGQPGKTDELGFVPNLYYVQPLTDGWAVGIGINGPFGLESNYDNDWTGRYLATHSQLEVVNIGVSAAYEITDQLSAALGVSYQMLDVTLENQVDSTLGVAPDPTTDSHARVSGDDNAVVMDLSLYYEPISGTRFGLIWRQGGDFSLSGDAQFTFNAACAQGAGFPTGAPPAPTTGTLCAAALSALQGSIEADVELPDTLTLSASHAFNERWTLHGDIAWTDWDSIQTIEVTNTESDAVVDVLDLQYDNTVRYAIGTTYSTGGPWTFRAGVARDEAPQTDPTLVTPRIPDQDRTWISAGFNYAFSETLTMDLGYAHLFVDDTAINDVDSQTGHQVVGEFESSVDIVGVQANWRF